MCVKEIFSLGKKYPFYHPPQCLNENCQSQRIWGHGYRDLYFDDISGQLSMKRYRCADCGVVYILRPSDYFGRHHASKILIINRLSKRINDGFWDTSRNLTRQRQGHWLKALKKNIVKYLGIDFTKDLINGFHKLMDLQKVPILRSD